MRAHRFLRIATLLCGVLLAPTSMAQSEIGMVIDSLVYVDHWVPGTAPCSLQAPPDPETASLAESALLQDWRNPRLDIVRAPHGRYRLRGTATSYALLASTGAGYYTAGQGNCLGLITAKGRAILPMRYNAIQVEPMGANGQAAWVKALDEKGWHVMRLEAARRGVPARITAQSNAPFYWMQVQRSEGEEPTLKVWQINGDVQSVGLLGNQLQELLPVQYQSISPVQGMTTAANKACSGHTVWAGFRSNGDLTLRDPCGKALEVAGPVQHLLTPLLNGTYPAIQVVRKNQPCLLLDKQLNTVMELVQSPSGPCRYLHDGGLLIGQTGPDSAQLIAFNATGGWQNRTRFGGTLALFAHGYVGMRGPGRPGQPGPITLYNAQGQALLDGMAFDEVVGGCGAFIDLRRENLYYGFDTRNGQLSAPRKSPAFYFSC